MKAIRESLGVGGEREMTGGWRGMKAIRESFRSWGRERDNRRMGRKKARERVW